MTNWIKLASFLCLAIRIFLFFGGRAFSPLHAVKVAAVLRCAHIGQSGCKVIEGLITMHNLAVH